MSSGVFTVLSRYSRKSASPMPPTRPARKDNMIFLPFAGRAGVAGTIAGSTTRMLDERKAPEMLLSGNHAEIERWRHRKAIEKTLRCRPDLIHGRALSEHERQEIDEILKEIGE